MRTTLFAATLLALIPCAVHAADPVDVIRPGDGAMSCKALAAEINDLTRGQVKRRQKAAAKSNGGGLGGMLGGLRAFARPALDRLVSESHGSTMAAAVTARDVLDETQSVGDRMPRPSRPAVVEPSVKDLRLKRLNDIHATKRC